MERCLEAFDEHDTPNLDRPIINGEEREQEEVVNDQGGNDIPPDWEEIPAPEPARVDQANERRAVNVTVICPLCTHIMRLKPAGKGGMFYGCT